MVATHGNTRIAANVEILQLGGTRSLTAWGSAGNDDLFGNGGVDTATFGGARVDDAVAVYSNGDGTVRDLVGS